MNKALLTVLLGSAMVVGCAQHKPTVDADGTVEQPIKMEQVPQVVMFSFQKDHPRITPKKIEKETYTDGTVHYEFEWSGVNGAEVEAAYNVEGELLDSH